MEQSITLKTTKSDLFKFNLRSVKKQVIISSIAVAAIAVVSIILLIIDAKVNGESGAWAITENLFFFSLVAVVAYVMFWAGTLLTAYLSGVVLASKDKAYFETKTVYFTLDAVIVTDINDAKSIFYYKELRIADGGKNYFALKNNVGMPIIIPAHQIDEKLRTEIKDSINKALCKVATA